ATLNSPPLTWMAHSCALRKGMTPGSRRWTRAPRERKSSAPSGRMSRAGFIDSVSGIRIGGQRRPGNHHCAAVDTERRAPPEKPEAMPAVGEARITAERYREPAGGRFGGEAIAVRIAGAAVA